MHIKTICAHMGSIYTCTHKYICMSSKVSFLSTGTHLIYLDINYRIVRLFVCINNKHYDGQGAWILKLLYSHKAWFRCSWHIEVCWIWRWWFFFNNVGSNHTQTSPTSFQFTGVIFWFHPVNKIGNIFQRSISDAMEMLIQDIYKVLIN